MQNHHCFPGGTGGCIGRLKLGKAVRIKECWMTSAASERKKLCINIRKTDAGVLWDGE